MKIGLVTHMMDTENAGIGRYTENVVRNLLRIDKKNEYFLIHTNKVKYHFPGNYQEIQLPFFDSIPKKLITGALVFETICRDHQLDILHDLGQISPFFLPSKTKKILTIFDLSPILYPKYFTKLTHAYSKLFPLIVNNTDRIITISENSKRDIVRSLQVPEDKISITHPGVEDKFRPIRNKMCLGRVKAKYDLPKRFILFVGTIEPRKNLVSLIKAYASAINNLEDDIFLVVVGQYGWGSKDVYRLPQNLGIGKKVLFLGKVDDEDLPDLYSLAEFFVYPSFYEGFGLPALEAMACGCPVITSSTSSLSEITGNAAILINPTDIKSMTKAIINTISDKELRSKLIERGLNRIKKFGWENGAKKTLKIYEEIYENCQ